MADKEQLAASSDLAVVSDDSRSTPPKDMGSALLDSPKDPSPSAGSPGSAGESYHALNNVSGNLFGDNAEEDGNGLVPLKFQQVVDDPKTQWKLIEDEDVKLTKKYEKYLTIGNDDIVYKEDKIDALILQLKMAHIYHLQDDEQYAIIQERYPWIDDEDGDIDQFQYEEIQEMVAHMISIERHKMYDTKAKYDEGHRWMEANDEVFHSLNHTAETML